MNSTEASIEELHEMLSILQFLDVGVVVLDRDYQITYWNGFMENHSEMRTGQVTGKNIFEVFPGIAKDWLTRKIESVFHLNNRSFSIWKQRPYLMKFESYRPITGRSEYMYQNVTITPLVSLNGEVNKVCLILYDVTDTALRENAIQAANEKLHQLSQIDGLTKLFNRRTWEEKLNYEFKRLQRNKGICSLVMFDIDHFKNVNDTYGHHAGDEVIRAVSNELIHVKRDTDIAGRYGGEEFAVILPDTSVENSKVFCERLRVAIQNKKIICDDQIIPITISLGASEFCPNDVVPTKWIQRSDDALYRSKEGGRNMTSLALKVS